MVFTCSLLGVSVVWGSAFAGEGFESCQSQRQDKL